MSEFTDSFLKNRSAALDGIILGANPELIKDIDSRISERITAGFSDVASDPKLKETFEDDLREWLDLFRRRPRVFPREYVALVLHQVLLAARQLKMSGLASKMAEDAEDWGQWFASYCLAKKGKEPFLEFCRLLKECSPPSPSNDWSRGQRPFWRNVILFKWHSNYDASALAVLKYATLLSSPSKMNDAKYDLSFLCAQHALVLNEKFGTEARKGWLATWAKAFCEAEVSHDSAQLLSAPDEWRSRLPERIQVEQEKRPYRAIVTTPSADLDRPRNVVDLPTTNTTSSSQSG